jgi:predicted HD phosphohydrolase
MCTVDPAYFDKLSAPSVQSLEIQGGLMSNAEIEDFERNPFHQDAIQLRQWDDLAKDPNWQTEPIEAFEGCLHNTANLF